MSRRLRHHNGPGEDASEHMHGSVFAQVGVWGLTRDRDTSLTNNLTNNGTDKCGLRRASVECLPW
jgi:hypothetical protein